MDFTTLHPYFLHYLIIIAAYTGMDVGILGDVMQEVVLVLDQITVLSGRLGKFQIVPNVGKFLKFKKANK
ncbi:hypothetical protein [Anaerobacillus alkalilacustris]|uniref:hypothetical protein n=1 Tax=Anaerobacillus alkalilacustris TaxID=393763 RepID=UPI0011144DF8|nr:hypothetical protein [Anaerobacillus alkalilacustris]